MYYLFFSFRLQPHSESGGGVGGARLMAIGDYSGLTDLHNITTK